LPGKNINPYDRSLKILARLYPEIFLSLVMDMNEDIEVMVENPEINLLMTLQKLLNQY